MFSAILMALPKTTIVTNHKSVTTIHNLRNMRHNDIEFSFLQHKNIKVFIYFCITIDALMLTT